MIFCYLIGIKKVNPEYRPTPKINQELTDNARIIHNIMSVPNRVELKRNQICNQAYEDYLKILDETSAKTSIKLDDLVKELNNSENNSDLKESNNLETEPVISSVTENSQENFNKE